MIGFLVDPYKQEITEVDVEDGLQSMYKHIQADCVDAAYLGDSDDVWVDDEGLLNVSNETRLFGFPTYRNALAGYGLILGTNSEGESVEPHRPIEYYRENVRFLKPADLLLNSIINARE